MNVAAGSRASADMDEAALRHWVSAWAREHVHDDWRERLRGAEESAFLTFQRWWFESLRDAGLLAAHWPSEWGGGGFSLVQQAVIAEELARARAPQLTVNSVALYHGAATLLAAGTDEQRHRHLPAILEGEVWCQGFSEPNAGSDLASLQTRAVWTGEGWIVSGQKTWSSYAQYADFCLLLARTDQSVPKRKGISCLILDLRSDGIDIRPIKQSTGEEEFCEIFLDDVFIPRENLIGPEHAGWQVAQTTLAAERGVQVLEHVERLCASRAQLARDLEDRLSGELDAAVAGCARQELGALYAETEILRIICHRMLEGGSGPEASIIKVMYAETLRRLDDAGTRWSGLEGQLERPLLRGASWETGDWLVDYLAFPGWTIGGGTTEILRNIVAERVLGLPREPEVRG
jgi:alkylation response protein AidB-like acyl-CoA dehydrogenase